MDIVCIILFKLKTGNPISNHPPHDDHDDDNDNDNDNDDDDDNDDDNDDCCRVYDALIVKVSCWIEYTPLTDFQI
jgi:hypothetical protein